jgi:sirohydrochlorin cobaltochelatase
MAGSATMKAIILFAHGSRDPLWHGPIKAIATRIKEMSTDLEVRCAYLELTEPTLMQTTTELSKLGCTQVHITPLFLGVGKHAREDLPQLVQELKQSHPLIEITCAPSIGEDARMIDAIAKVSLNPHSQPALSKLSYQDL